MFKISVKQDSYLKNLLYFLAVYFPLEGFLMNFVPASAVSPLRYGLEAVIYLMLGILFLKRRFRLRVPYIGAGLLIFIFGGLISALLNDVPPLVTALGFRILVRYIAVYIIAANLQWDEREKLFLIRLISLSLLIQICVSLLEIVGGSSVMSFFQPQQSVEVEGLEKRKLMSLAKLDMYIVGTMTHYNDFAYFTGLCTIVLFVYATLYKKRDLLTIGTILAGFTFVIISNSRSGLLGVIVAYLVLMNLTNRESFLGYAKKVLVLFLLLCVGFVIFINVKPDVAESLMQKSEILTDVESWTNPTMASNTRLAIMKAVIDEVKRSWSSFIFGLGPGLFTTQMLTKAMGKGLGLTVVILTFISDNQYASVLGQYGLVGLFAFFAMTLYRVGTVHLKRLSGYLQSDRLMAMIAICLVADVAVIAFSSPALEMRYVIYYLWLFGGVAASCCRSSNNKVVPGPDNKPLPLPKNRL